jgi:hypothetical protein
MTYNYLLMVHSWLRWAFLLAALYAIIRSLNGKFGNKPFGKEDNTAATILIALTHTMLLLGLALWFISPKVQHAISKGASYSMDLTMDNTVNDKVKVEVDVYENDKTYDLSGVLKVKVLRALVIEHPLINIIAVVLIQIGRIKSKKAYEDAVKHNRSLIYYGLGLLLILSRIPWGTSPLFRGME